MVSKASDDLPLPETPVITTRLFFGIEIVTFFRLCSRAPRTTMASGSRPFTPEGVALHPGESKETLFFGSRRRSVELEYEFIRLLRVDAHRHTCARHRTHREHTVQDRARLGVVR